jgi:hypothetical protein
MSAYPPVRGLNAARQLALVRAMDELAAAGDVDREVSRRAAWLAMALRGRPHGYLEELPFVDAGPLAPAMRERIAT